MAEVQRPEASGKVRFLFHGWTWEVDADPARGAKCVVPAHNPRPGFVSVGAGTWCSGPLIVSPRGKDEAEPIGPLCDLPAADWSGFPVATPCEVGCCDALSEERYVGTYPFFSVDAATWFHELNALMALKGQGSDVIQYLTSS